jgi:hypothetical protein
MTILRNAARQKRYRVLAVVLLLGLLLWSPLGQAHVKAVLLISEVLPQVPLKPLGLLTDAPAHSQLTLHAAGGPVVADLFRPVPRLGTVAPHSRPALILAMGVRAKASDKAMLLNLAATISRLGYVVLWPRLAVLDHGSDRPEQPDTFVQSIRYLSELDIVAPRRISLLGFSVGSALAFVAASDPRVRRDVRAVIFFGGYYDLDGYLVSLATHTSQIDGTTIAWSPDREATSYVKKVLRTQRAWGVLRLFTTHSRAAALAVLRQAPPAERALLRAISPSSYLHAFGAHLFILHDKGDHFVPYVESVKLDRALPPTVQRSMLISSLFEHTHPKGGVSGDFIGGVLSLYGFLHAILDDL